MSIEAIAYVKSMDLAECEKARLLMYVLAENTFNDSCICVLGIEQLAYEVRLNERTVRRQIDALVEARFLLRKRRYPEAGGRLNDALRIVGFKRWYRDNHASAKRAHKARTKPDNPRPDGVGLKDKMSGSHTGQQMSGVSGHLESATEESRNLPVNSPPNPQGGDSVGADALKDAERLIVRLNADRPYDPAVGGLVAPLLRQRRFSATDPLKSLKAACEAAQGFSAAHLAKVLELVLAADVRTIKTDRLLDAIEAVRKGGLMLVVAKGSAEFAAWRTHYEKTLPNVAALMARSDRWQVPAQFPPNKIEAA